MIFLVILMGCASPGPPTGKSAPGGSGEDVLVPPGALYLLAKSRSETCETCRKEMEKDAFAELSKSLTPGRPVRGAFQVAVTPRGRLLTLAGLPSWVFFRFHTKAKHWAGVEEKDFTDEDVARRLFAAENEARFAGEAVLIFYPYAEGPSFEYVRKNGSLEIECRVTRINPYVEEQ